MGIYYITYNYDINITIRYPTVFEYVKTVLR